MNLHRLAEERSLALHRAIADRLTEDPAVLDRARARVQRWIETGEVAPYWARQWDAVALPLRRGDPCLAGGPKRACSSASSGDAVRRCDRPADTVAHLARGSRGLGGNQVRRLDLEHIIRAAAEIADDPEIVVIGSQAILGASPTHRLNFWCRWKRTSTPRTAPTGPT